MVKQQRRSRLQPQQCLGEALDKEVSALELKLAASEVERERLTGELWQAQSRCRDLEELASAQLSQAFEHRRLAEEAQNHSDELRNQLALVSQQLSLSQQQYYNANQLLEQARYQDGQLRAKLAEGQTMISYLEAEKEHLTLKVGELEKQKEDQEKDHSTAMADMHKQHAELQERHSSAEARAANAELMRSSLEKQSDDHFRRYESETGGRLQEMEAQLKLRNSLVEALRGALKTYQALTEELQASHIESTMDFAKTLAALRKILPASTVGSTSDHHNLENAFEEDAQRAKHLEDLAKKMHRSLKGLCGCGAMWSGNCKTLQARCESTEATRTHLESELSRHRSVLEKKKEGRVQKLKMSSSNISAQVAAALEGIEVEKLTLKGKREPRKLQLWSDPKSKATGLDAMVVRWAKKPYKSFAKDSCFSLNRVVFIGYGSAARAWALFDDVKPELCLSIFTFARSFDFICRSAADAEAFVVTLSRFCRYAQGWRVAGALESKNSFLAASGWSKLQVAARRKGPKLSGRLLDGLAKAYLHHKGKSPPSVGLREVDATSRGGTVLNTTGQANPFHLGVHSVPAGAAPPRTSPPVSVSAAAAPLLPAVQTAPTTKPQAPIPAEINYGPSEASAAPAAAQAALAYGGSEASGTQPYTSIPVGGSPGASEASPFLGGSAPSRATAAQGGGPLASHQPETAATPSPRAGLESADMGSPGAVAKRMFERGSEGEPTLEGGWGGGEEVDGASLPVDRAAERGRFDRERTDKEAAAAPALSHREVDPTPAKKTRQSSKDKSERERPPEEQPTEEELAFQQQVSSFARAPSTLGAAGSFDDGASSPRRAQPSIQPAASFDEGASSPRRGPSSLVSGGLAAVRRGRAGSKQRSQPKPYD